MPLPYYLQKKPAQPVYIAGGELTTGGQPTSADNPMPMTLPPDAQTGKLSSGQWTLSATPNTVATINVPDWARGFRIRPSGGNCRFAVGENPVAQPADALGVGDFAVDGIVEARLLADGTGRTLRILSATASITVLVGFFG